MKFKDKAHKEFYERMLKQTQSQNDPYRKALFYTLGLTEETRKHSNELYRDGGIESEGLSASWQTSATLQVCKLAFNLYNNYCYDDDHVSNDYTPYNLFACDLMMYFFEAVKLRFEEYCEEV